MYTLALTAYRLMKITQPVPSATGKGALASGGSESSAAGAPVRLVVNATSNSEISSNPILVDGPPGSACYSKRPVLAPLYNMCLTVTSTY